ncbi:pilus assembly protein PilN [Legionella antarctica]|uniref:Pilus assembly protein PilN n=1 Tax=Legionella antarctica TaxID=2708020 RepID=A0A6F8T7H4_9GAMM|nr:PilN domain-containing protein [Legionella antarctica]BCA95916.1 pilus assembly protein PilN [Legionella antarctica]
MTQINLLPWREQKREQEKKVFTTILIASSVFAAFIVIIVNYYASELVSNQTSRNQILQKEINSLEAQIKEINALTLIRKALISRMSIVQNLQSTRTLMVHLFDELIQILPQGIYVTKLERKNDMVNLWGYSESNTNISILMRNIETNVWIQNPNLTEIKKMDNKQPANNEFKLSFILKSKY